MTKKYVNRENEQTTAISSPALNNRRLRETSNRSMREWTKGKQQYVNDNGKIWIFHTVYLFVNLAVKYIFKVHFGLWQSEALKFWSQVFLLTPSRTE